MKPKNIRKALAKALDEIPDSRLEDMVNEVTSLKAMKWFYDSNGTSVAVIIISEWAMYTIEDLFNEDMLKEYL